MGRLLADGTDPRRISMAGVGATVAVAGASVVAFRITASRCQTSPPDDASSEWSFSPYCRALHAVHVANYPDSVSGGGALEAVFVFPALICVIGLIIALRARAAAPIRQAFVIGGGFVLLLTVLALVLASATLHPCC